ncbi:calcium-responsive transcription factor isoform X2 [Scleropages formosus]|uniref:Calcium responsive transcription factor n=1 Tax=Scleropages formosus TaxID=113540 RepID=A0A8C9S866_SCLFO|nr:calcium-responsive transcription factor isoform X2 [Scleropages formosus]
MTKFSDSLQFIPFLWIAELRHHVRVAYFLDVYANAQTRVRLKRPLCRSSVQDMDEQVDGVERVTETPSHPDTHIFKAEDNVQENRKEHPVAMLVADDSQHGQNPSEPGDRSSRSEQLIIFDQNGQALQCDRMVIVTGQSEGELYVLPSSHLGRAQVLLPQGGLLDIADSTGPCEEKTVHEELQTVTMTAIANSTPGLTVVTPPPGAPTEAAENSPDCFTEPLQPLPPSAPSWAHRLHNCEKIGESYRGFCTTETELEAVLMLHKQETHSVFGTRQSPSPAKPATRLMWKSQYVPYDGIPFVNAGSRAIVMECQFGPRRKGLQPKKVTEQENSQNPQYKATCPARIYIKKVRKFPEYSVPTDPKVDKKVVRQEQEKAFFNLKKSLWDAGGVLRYYVQLPTQKAHLYHDVDPPLLPPSPVQLPLPNKEELLENKNDRMAREGVDTEQAEDGSCVPSRLHPRVAEKICELVAQGHSQVYTVRKQLRKFVEREMFKSDEVPERHNLCYFPTVNDIKNHIHEAQKALQQNRADLGVSATDTQWTTDAENPLTETVTLTLTQTPGPVEVAQKTGVLEGTETMSPEAVQLFSSLTAIQPKIFAQLRGIQLQPVLCPGEGLPPQPPVALSCSGPELLDPSNQNQFLQPSASLVEGISLTDSSGLLGMGQLVSVSVLGDGPSDSRVQQILLGDAQTIPVQIVEAADIGETSFILQHHTKTGRDDKLVPRSSHKELYQYCTTHFKYQRNNHSYMSTLLSSKGSLTQLWSGGQLSHYYFLSAGNSPGEQIKCNRIYPPAPSGD